MKNLFLIAIIVLGFSGISFGQDGNTNYVLATSSAKIIAQLEITQEAGLDFGTIGAKSTATNVTIAATAAGTRGGTADLIATAIGNSGEFSVTGQPSSNFSITLAAAATTLSPVTGTGDPMVIGSWLASGDLTGHTTDGDGAATFYVGATLTVGASQDAATYTGTYDVTIHYE